MLCHFFPPLNFLMQNHLLWQSKESLPCFADSPFLKVHRCPHVKWPQLWSQHLRPSHTHTHTHLLIPQGSHCCDGAEHEEAGGARKSGCRRRFCRESVIVESREEDEEEEALQLTTDCPEDCWGWRDENEIWGWGEEEGGALSPSSQPKLNLWLSHEGEERNWAPTKMWESERRRVNESWKGGFTYYTCDITRSLLLLFLSSSLQPENICWTAPLTPTHSSFWGYFHCWPLNPEMISPIPFTAVIHPVVGVEPLKTAGKEKEFLAFAVKSSAKLKLSAYSSGSCCGTFLIILDCFSLSSRVFSPPWKSLFLLWERLCLIPDGAPRPDALWAHGYALPHALAPSVFPLLPPWPLPQTHPDRSELGGPTHQRHKPDMQHIIHTVHFIFHGELLPAHCLTAHAVLKREPDVM